MTAARRLARFETAALPHVLGDAYRAGRDPDGRIPGLSGADLPICEAAAGQLAPVLDLVLDLVGGRG